MEPSDKLVEGELYLCTGLDNTGKDQCEFLCLCTGPEDEDDAGCFFKGEFISASCLYWQHWMSEVGAPGCLSTDYVFHACSVRDCDTAFYDESCEVIHVPMWVRLDPDVAMNLIVDWHRAENEIDWPEWYFGALPKHLEERWDTPPGAVTGARGRGRGSAGRADGRGRSAPAAGRPSAARARGGPGGALGRPAG